MKEAVTKVFDTLTQKDFHGAFQMLLEWYKCIAAGRDYFEGDFSFMRVLSIKVPMRKKSGNLFDDPCITKNLIKEVICFHTIKWSSSSINDYSIKHNSFVCTQLKFQTFLFKP